MYLYSKPLPQGDRQQSNSNVDCYEGKLCVLETINIINIEIVW